MSPVHPGPAWKNPGYPTCWHARGCGLLAANPLGRDHFDRRQPAFNDTLEKERTAVFRYRVAIYTHAATPEDLNREAARFAGQSE